MLKGQKKRKKIRYNLIHFLNEKEGRPLTITKNGYVTNAQWLVDPKLFKDPLFIKRVVKERMFGEHKVINDEVVMEGVEKNKDKYKPLEFVKEVYKWIGVGDYKADMYVYKDSNGNGECHYIDKKYMSYFERRINGMKLEGSELNEPVKILNGKSEMVGLVMGFKNMSQEYESGLSLEGG